MSIYIKGATVPETCWDCFIDNSLAQNIAYFEAICPFTERIVTFAEFDAMSGRHPDCPLVPVPTPHGRLIDGDNVIDLLREQLTGDRDTVYEYYDDGIEMAISELSIVPTIIEAEEGEEE